MFNLRQNFATARGAGLGNGQAAAAASQAGVQNASAMGRAAIGNAGDYVRGIPGAAYNTVVSNPMAVAGAVGALGAGYVGNQMMGDPIGQGIQGFGNMVNGSEWDSQYGSPIDGQGYNQLGGVGDNLYQQQVADSMTSAERAGNFQHNLQSQASQQGYNQELGMQINRLQSEREMQNNQLQAAQANQMLNGYVDMIQSANQRASSVAGNRY